MTDTKIKISAETAEAERALRTLGSEVVGLSGRMGSLSGIAGTLGGVLSISAFAGFIKGSIDAADHLNDLSKITHLTVEQLSGVSLAAKQSGSDLTGTANAISKLAENMGKDGEKFAKLGITAKDPIEAFKQLADVFNAIKDPQQQAAFGATALGKSWKESAPLLAEGSARIGEMVAKGTALAGPIKVAAEQADLFNDQLAEMEAQGSGLGIMLANVMLPNLTATATAMNDLAREGHPVLALWRGLAGMGQIPWDFLFPPEDLKKKLSSESMIKDLQAEIGQLERNKESGNGWLMKKIFGTPEEIDQNIAILKARIETLRTHGADLDKPAAAASSPKPGTPAGIKAFIDDGSGDAKEVAHTASLNKEFVKRMALIYKEREEDAKKDAVHRLALDAEIERQQSKYDQLHEMALQYTATDAERVTWKLAFDFDHMEKERAAAIAHGAWNIELETSYNQARIEREAMAAEDIARINDEALKKKQQADALEIQFMRASFAFKKSMRIADLGNSLDLLAQATSGMAHHSRKAFEINKVATISNIAVKSPGIIVDAYKSGLNETGSMWGGAAYAAAAAIAVYAQLSAAQSATFGGGGSVAPSSGGTAGMSASGAASQAGTQPQASTTTSAPAAQPITINLYNTGTFVDAQAFIDGTVIPQIQDQIANADVLLIDPRSRQAQLLAGA